MNVMIYEDNGGCVGSLEGIVSRYFRKRSIKFSMFITRPGAFCDFNSGNNGDIVFIDTDGQESDAINFAKTVKQKNRNSIIFLFTDRLQIIPEMMKVGIFQVILKPVDADLIYDELDRAVQLYADIYSTYNISVGSIHKEKERFVGRSFARCHCGFLVNMQYITEYGKNYIKMCDGKEIPVSRQYREEFMLLYKKYLETKTVH